MNSFFPSFLMNFDEKKKNQDAEKCYLRDVTNARDVTIDVDTCRQAGKKKGYATQLQNQTAERIIVIINNNITDSLFSLIHFPRFKSFSASLPQSEPSSLGGELVPPPPFATRSVPSGFGISTGLSSSAALWSWSWSS